jgi:hypothetical protein
MGYVSGLMVTDGTIYSKVTKKCTYNHMSISGGEYLKELQDYLIEYGYANASLCISRKTGTKTNYGAATKDMYLLNLSNRCARLIARNLQLTTAKQHKLQKIVESKGQNRTCTTKITDIVYAGKQLVYDITVPEVKRFVANGVIVHNCEWFMFYCEYALSKWGAANIRYSNGEPAHTTNPSNYPLVCKHIYALGKKALR